MYVNGDSGSTNGHGTVMSLAPFLSSSRQEHQVAPITNYLQATFFSLIVHS